MICPRCEKPYYFIRPEKETESLCLRCKYTAPFRQPAYDEYHENLYCAKPYIRTEKTDPQMRFILNTLSIQPSVSVLDIGCGVGDYTKAISLYTKNVVGFDRDISAAQEKYPDVSFESHDCNTRFPIKDSSLDIVVCINLIEHLVDYKHFLTECHRILKPKGKIAITTANLDFILHDYFFDKTHVHEWTLDQFKNIIKPFFNIAFAKKSSSMFNYYPFNHITTHFLKPDLLVIATKK